MPPKNIAELKPWDLVHVDLIGPYSKSIIQQLFDHNDKASKMTW